MPHEFTKWQHSLPKENWQRELEKAYGLPESSWMRYEDIYRIHNSMGTFALKQILFPEDDFRYIALAMEHLNGNGFKRLNRIISTIKGELFAEAEGKRYFLSPWLQGRIADYKEKEDVITAASALAELHIASTGYVPPYYKGRIKWGELLPRLKQKVEEMKVWKELVNRRDEICYLDLLYRKYCKRNIEEAKEAIAILEPVYAKVNARESQRGCFCHHDFAHHNVIVDYDGKAWVLDFDYCISDTNCHDLASFLIRVMKANNWDIELAVTGWQTYHALRPLSEEEKQMVEGLLHFPQDFWQVGFCRYIEGGHLEERLERRLFLWLSTLEAREKALEEFSEVLGDFRFECDCQKAEYEKDDERSEA